MKRQILLFLMLVFSSLVYAQSESPNPKVFTTPDIVWCGIDFSEAKCIGPMGFTEPDQVKSKYFDAWNQLVLIENKKYNFLEFYKKSNFTYDLSTVSRRNTLPNIDELVISKPYTFQEGQIDKIIKSYDLEDAKEGLGVVYVVESLDKLTTSASIYVVFFDIANKEILWSKKYKANPGGFGFRNYWAGAIHHTMQLSEEEYNKALKQLKRKKS